MQPTRLHTATPTNWHDLILNWAANMGEAVGIRDFFSNPELISIASTWRSCTIT